MLRLTGKEVILYILQNNLENEVVIQDGIFIDLVNEEKAAVNFNVGMATINVWRKFGMFGNNQHKRRIINRE